MEPKGAEEWKLIWKKALLNMPCWRRRPIITEWMKAEPMSLPDFIRGHAYGDLKGFNGSIWRRYYRGYGQSSLLTRLLGFHKPKCRVGCLCHERVRNGLDSGTRLKDDTQRTLLLAYASKAGRTLAIAQLKERGIIHRYEV